MLQRIWAGIAADWAVLAVFTLLALRQAPVAPSTTTSTTTHAVTSSSTVATRPSTTASATQVAAVTRTS